METNLESKLREVAEYDNSPTLNSNLPQYYKSSWAWLNPVWATVRKEIEGLYKKSVWTAKGKKQWLLIPSRYHAAIDTDNVAAAFEVVYEAVQLLKELKGEKK